MAPEITFTEIEPTSPKEYWAKLDIQKNLSVEGYIGSYSINDLITSAIEGTGIKTIHGKTMHPNNWRTDQQPTFIVSRMKLTSAVVIEENSQLTYISERGCFTTMNAKDKTAEEVALALEKAIAA